MKTMTAVAMGLAATLGCSTLAFAQSENIDVTAQRFHQNAPIAVAGTVAERDGNNLILNRSDGQMLAKIAEPSDNLGRYARLTSSKATIASRFALGDDVMVYGRLDKTATMPQVRADAVADPHTGRLMLTETGDRTLGDRPLPARLKYASFDRAAPRASLSTYDEFD